MLSSRAFRILSLGAAIALTLAACGGGSGTPTPPPAPVNPLERDTSFGTAGEARFTMGPLGGYIGATTAQSDGKLLLAGYRTLQTGTDLTKPRNELFVRRLLANGQADAAFGQAGETVFSVLGNDNVQGILVQPDGKIVVVLWVIEPCNAGIPIGSCFSAAGILAKVGTSLVRLNADGTLDRSFGNQGVMIEYIGPQRSGPAPTVALQPDGKLLMLRTTSDHLLHFDSWKLHRYLPNGSADPAFSGGQAVSSRCTADGQAIGLQPDGRIIVAGAGYGQGQARFCIERLMPDGQADTSFPVTWSNISMQAMALRVLTNGDIQLAGPSADAAGWRLIATRYDAAGAQRKDYGTDGVAYLPAVGSTGAYDIHHVSIDTAGGVLAASALKLSTDPSTYQRNWLKLTSSGQPDTAFAPGGILAGAVVPASYAAAMEWIVDPQGRWITVDGNGSESVVTRFKGTQP